jgi:hypothetical protein
MRVGLEWGVEIKTGPEPISLRAGGELEHKGKRRETLGGDEEEEEKSATLLLGFGTLLTGD